MRAIVAAFLVAGPMFHAMAAEAQTSISVVSGARGGPSLAVAEALALVYSTAIPDARATTQVTRSANEALTQLQSGHGEVAIASGEVLTGAWRGDEQAGFKTPLDKLRGLAAAYDTYVQIVARADSGIRTVSDLRGKRVSVGVARSSTELNARAIMKAAGMSYRDLAKVEYFPFGQSAELIKDRQLDATLQSTVAGAASLRDLASAVKLVVVAIPADVVARAGDLYRPATIAANTYAGQANDVPTAAIRNFLVTQSNVSDELAYRMTKALYDHLDTLHAAQAITKEMKLETALTGLPLPLHPGAELYYREVGLIK